MTSFRAKPPGSIEELLHIRQIEHLKYQYMRAIDTLDWELMELCIAENASAWWADGAIRAEGSKNILEFFRNNLKPDHFSSHIALHPEISILGPASAEGIWRFQDSVFSTKPADQPGTSHGLQGGQKVEGAGIYHDEYVLTQDGWRIQSTGYIRLYEYWTSPDYPCQEGFSARAEHALKTCRARGLKDILPSQ